MKLSSVTWLSQEHQFPMGPKGMYSPNGIQTPVPVPYERCERSKDKDNEDVTVFKLRTNPTSDDSPTYDLKALTFKTGTVEEYIMWKRDLAKIMVGQRVIDPAGKYAMTRRLLDGDALAAFDRAAERLGNETNVHYYSTMQELAKHVFPAHALVLQRQWFRRYMRKPGKHKMREYVARINEINAMLVEFPPAFNVTQKIDDDEMKDLLEFSIPWQWRIEMVKQAFRPVEHTIPEIMEFCEHQEIANAVQDAVDAANKRAGQQGQSYKRKATAIDGSSWKSQTNKSRTNKHKQKGKCLSYKESNGRDGCRLHQETTTHTTAECRTINKQIDNMKGVYDAQPRGYGVKRQKFQNKSDNKPKAPGGDLHTLLNDVESIRARVEKEIKQQQQEGGKRKRDENVQEEAREESQPVAQPESDMDNYNDELEQLTLSDVHDSDLEGLEPLSEEEFEA
jgi:hypothetical protein